MTTRNFKLQRKVLLKYSEIGQKALRISRNITRFGQKLTFRIIRHLNFIDFITPTSNGLIPLELSSVFRDHNKFADERTIRQLIDDEYSELTKEELKKITDLSVSSEERHNDFVTYDNPGVRKSLTDFEQKYSNEIKILRDLRDSIDNDLPSGTNLPPDPIANESKSVEIPIYIEKPDYVSDDDWDIIQSLPSQDEIDNQIDEATKALHSFFIKYGEENKGQK